MKLSSAYKTMSTLLAANLPVMLRGTMGIGKSDMVKSYCKANNKKLIEIRLSQLSVIDLMGVFMLDDTESRFARPSILPKEDEANVVLFLDEITSAADDVQAAAYQILLDKQVGPHKFHPSLQIVAAGNLETDNGIVNELAAPLKNRLSHITVELDKDDWLNWAMNNEIAEEVVGFIAYMGMPKLYSYNQDNKDDAFATPRTWEYASNAFKAAGNDVDIQRAVVSACVGGGITHEFMAFVNVRNKMPDLEAVLAGKNVPPPESVDVCWAVGVALAQRVEVHSFKAAHDYISSFKSYSKEIGLFMLRHSMVRKPQIRSAPGFIDCLKVYGEALQA